MFFALEPRCSRRCPSSETASGPRCEALLPGPVTLLLPNPRAPLPARVRPGEGGADTLGLRVPALERLRWPRSARRCAPVLQSSANLSGEPDARRLRDVPASIRAGADLVLDGGELPGVASTVLDLREYERRGEWQIVREGPSQARGPGADRSPPGSLVGSYRDWRQRWNRPPGSG